MDDGVWILGGYQSDFARNLIKARRAVPVREEEIGYTRVTEPKRDDKRIDGNEVQQNNST